MEITVTKPERRGRKRKNHDVQNVTVDGKGKKRVAETRSKALVGRYVRKEFAGSGVFLGKISYYDSGLYRVNYEDGDCEDLDGNEVREVIIEDNYYFEDKWLERKRKLNELLEKKDIQANGTLVENVVEVQVNDKPVENVVEVQVNDTPVENVVEVQVNDTPVENVVEVKVNYKPVENIVESVSVIGGKAEGSLLTDLSNAGGGGVIDDGVKVEEGDDADSFSDLSEDSSADVEAAPLVPPPQLPPSSGNIGVPEEYVSYLFSVYGFLRSFSIQLFLSPFGLDDFVGSLNNSEPNTLLDSIHVALMRVLRRHFQMLSSDGSELASKCLRCMDWSLLDALTWPVYLVQYLLVLGYTDRTEWKEFYIHALEKDYYTLSVGRKLLILQILCDDVLDSEELKAEVDMREESEVGLDSDEVTIVAPESKPKRVHPRYSKTSACKDHKTMDIIAEGNERSSFCKSSSLGFKAAGLDAGADVDQDGNNDECRLCGMDGTLLCCDGCPSAYHTRCIGVMKLSIPEGVWYCPECAINRIGPTIMKGTSLRGAEMFGVDSYGQVFLGTCNHLLVLKDSTNIEPCCKYYHQNYIPRVLQALNSSVQHIVMYSEICNRILQYWEILDVFAHTETAEMATQLANRKEGSECYPPLLTMFGKECHNVSEVLESEHFASCVTEPNKTSMDTMTHHDHYVQQRTVDTTMKQDCPPVDTKLPGQIKFEHTMSAGSVGQQAYTSDLIQQSLADKSSLIENAICTSANSNSRYKGYMNGMHFAANMPSQGEEAFDILGHRGYNISACGCLYMGSSSQSYINNYVQADFSASAAANLAVISSEENRISESHASDNRRKLMSANVSIQVKAFSLTAIRFFWPNTEKKIVDVPRERCGWCLSCKAAVTSKKGCLLNAAASNAIKGPMKILADLRPAKNLEGSLSGIATYLMLMEKSLCGLTIGRFLSASYREQWLKQVEQATTLSAIKILLLELEESIRFIALSSDWVKLVDNWFVESSATQSGTSAAGSMQKRGPGRPSRKPSATSEVTSNDCQDILSDFLWWRGGMLSKLIIQKGTLPHSVVKKVARHGGRRKITDIHYTEGSEIPKRSRQLVWRAAVEMSKTASQLALQVRYLDVHVRWNDLIRPEQSDGERRSTSQSLQDGKGPESEASAFRNASICDKKIVENKIRYCVAFGNQKHLPSRVMKNIIEVEQSHNGKEKYWFFETRIPLYLIKEYEENMLKVSLPYLPPADKTSSILSKLQRRQLKASRKDIFSYLLRRRDNMDICFCASCQLDVLLGNALTCSACQGYCHEQCTLSSTVLINEEVEFVITCNKCYHTKALDQTENSDESPTSPLLPQGQEFRNAVRVTEGRQVGYSRSLSSTGTLERSDVKSATHDSSLARKNKRKLCSWGLIWKKKNSEDTGIDFRLQNILLKGNPDMNWSDPKCHLCHQPYNSDLMYIRCETCKHWYHADAVELEESKIFALAGFKCCKCRRIKSPLCPYGKPDIKKLLEGKKPRPRASKQVDYSGLDVDSEIISEQVKGLPSTPVLPMQEVVYIPDDDPLSLSRVEQFTEHNSEPDYEWNSATISGGPQKLPVRRHMKDENDLDCCLANNTTQAEISTSIEGNLFNPAEGSLLPHVEWDVSTNGFEDNMMFDYDCLNYEDIGFEPQTYFSFTELLESDDGGKLDGVDPSGNATGSGQTLCEFSNDRIPGATYDQQEPTISPEYAVDIVPCKICSQTEPCPDLSCQICGIWMHSHCSPGIEQSSWEGGWRCGNCREWGTL